MRTRDRIIGSLESAYREAFEAAQADGNQAEMTRLDLEFQKDQIYMEILLDIRTALTSLDPGTETKESKSILDKAKAIRRFTKLR